jgi:hypothetical protein
MADRDQNRVITAVDMQAKQRVVSAEDLKRVKAALQGVSISLQGSKGGLSYTAVAALLKKLKPLAEQVGGIDVLIACLESLAELTGDMA